MFYFLRLIPTEYSTYAGIRYRLQIEHMNSAYETDLHLSDDADDVALMNVTY